MTNIINVSIDAACQAGDLLAAHFGKPHQVESKGDRNLATNVDKEAEKLIVDKIRTHFPDHGILAEEGGTFGLDREYLWIIDPLDGTHNYIRDIDIFGVSIGVVHRGDFIAGVIYMPKDHELYIAEKDSGAYKNDKKISVSKTDVLKECSISFDSSIRYSPKVMLAVLEDLAREVFNIRMLGSSVRALTYIAEGKLDFSVEFYDRPWDFAGGVCLIEEAGGRLTSLKKTRLDYKTIGYIASNSAIHDKVQDIVSAHLTSR